MFLSNKTQKVLGPNFSKRTDPETGLVYFGKRYYAPEQVRWLTPDPAGFTDSINLYQYALNNPLKYYDPYGDNLLGFLCGIVQVAAGAAVMATGVALEVATFGGYTIALGVHESVGIALVTSGCAMTAYHAQDLSWPTSTPKAPSMDWRSYQKNKIKNESFRWIVVDHSLCNGLFYLL